MPIKRQAEYATLLDMLGSNIAEAARIMREASYSSTFETVSAKLRGIEQESDDAARRIFELLDTAPDLPSWVEDRWDFIGFSHGLDNVVDLMEEIVSWGEAFGLSPSALNLPYEEKSEIEKKLSAFSLSLGGRVFEDFAKLIVLAASLTQSIIPLLDTMGKKKSREMLNDYIISISSIEQAGDKLWKKAMRALLSKAPESLEEVEERRHVERLLDRFEATFDEFKKVSLSIKTMMLKNA